MSIISGKTNIPLKCVRCTPLVPKTDVSQVIIDIVDEVNSSFKNIPPLYFYAIKILFQTAKLTLEWVSMVSRRTQQYSSYMALISRLIIESGPDNPVIKSISIDPRNWEYDVMCQLSQRTRPPHPVSSLLRQAIINSNPDVLGSYITG